MFLSSFCGRQLSHYGKAGRLELFSYFLVGLLTLFISMIPVVWVSWKYVNASIDFGPDAALMMSEDDGFSFLFLSWGVYLWCYVWYIWGAVFCVAQMMTVCRRLTAIGWSKWLWLLMVVPLVNFVFFIVLCIWPPKKDSDSESEAERA